MLNLTKGGRKAELGKVTTPWRKTGIEACNGFIQLIQELNDYEPESLKALFHEINEYDLQALRQVQSLITTNSQGLFKVTKSASLKRIVTSHNDQLVLKKKQTEPAPSPPNDVMFTGSDVIFTAAGGMVMV